MAGAAEISPGAFVSEDAQLGAGVAVAPGAVIEAGARLGPGTRIGAGTVIHAGVEVGPGTLIGAGTVIHAGVELAANCIVEEHVVLGKQPRLRAGSSAARDERLGPLVLDEGATVCCGAVIYGGTRIGAGAIIGDQTQVRERCEIGAGSIVGRGSTVDFDTRVGSRVKIQTSVYVTGGSLVEDEVFLAPACSPQMTTRWGVTRRGRRSEARCSGGAAASAEGPCSCPASRSGRMPSSRPERWSLATSDRARS
jgi:UDP-3-O-[3-hydroxymyristoyl] glucosamine N-acyltransferase